MRQKIKIGDIISLVGSIASVVGLFTIFFQKGLFRYIGMGIVVAYLFIMTVFVIRRYFGIKRIKNNIENEINSKLIDLGEHAHTTMHTLRDSLADIDKSKRITRDSFKNITTVLCDCINNFYDKLLDCKTNVCIKEIKAETILNSDIQSWEIVTLARSAASKQARSNIDHIPSKVSDNTDFEMILTEGRSDWFASPDLTVTKKKYKENGETFNNSRGDFLNFYRSTIVVPIRIRMDKIAQNLFPYGKKNLQSESLSFHVLGFLCIDSLQVFNENDERFMSGIEYAKTFADILYPLLETVLVTNVNQSLNTT